MPKILWITLRQAQGKPHITRFPALSKSISTPALLPYFFEDTRLDHRQELALDSLLTTTRNQSRNVLDHNFFLTLQEVHNSALSTVFLDRDNTKLPQL